jgi:hypothetical protein
MSKPDYIVWRSVMRIAETSEPIQLDRAGGGPTGRIPVALLVSLLLQAGLFVWWAAAMSARFDERLSQLQDRTQKLELSAQRFGESQSVLLERLVRAEEKAGTHAERLRRLEQMR